MTERIHQLRVETGARLHGLHFIHFTGQLIECRLLETAPKNVV
jgi:hypothetical protein